MSEKVDDVTFICPEQGTFWSTKFFTGTKSGAKVCHMRPNMWGMVDGTPIQVPCYLAANRALYPSI